MRILTTVASKHGATGEIGELIAGVLRDAGHEVESHAPETVASLEGWDAVVLGSAVYAGRWQQPARAFVDRHAPELAARPVYVFTSGPIGDPPSPSGEPAETIEIAERLGARAHRSFAGRLDRSRLGILERTVVRALKAPEGDFRDLDAIRAWADEIAAELRSSERATSTIGA
jgi:menaquinone-dependent protoporphyrinogen oxidase